MTTEDRIVEYAKSNGWFTSGQMIRKLHLTNHANATTVLKKMTEKGILERRESDKKGFVYQYRLKEGRV